MVSHYYTKTPPPFQAFQTENPAECTALFLASMLLLLTGCSHVTSEMKESRENGIALMESGDYEGAVAEFDSLIDQTTRVTSFEIDVLKFRGEAEITLIQCSFLFCLFFLFSYTVYTF